MNEGKMQLLGNQLFRRIRVVFDRFKKRTLLKLFCRKDVLVIIRLDSIGDYCLFRNFLQAIKKSKDFNGYRIVLVGNAVYKDLAEAFDRECIDEFIWVDVGRIYEKDYFEALASIISMLKAKILLHPVHSRTPIADHLASKVAAGKKIASAGDAVNYDSRVQKKLGDKVYDWLIEVPNEQTHEFKRNWVFFEKLLKRPDLNTTLKLPVARTNVKAGSDIQIAVCIGASDPRRRWSTDNFSQLINQLIRQYRNARLLILGSSADEPAANQIITALANENVSNYCGKTTLSQLAVLLSQSALAITNDSAALHIACSVGTPVVCISNGNHFGRFTDLKQHFRVPVHAIYPPELLQLIQLGKNAKEQFTRGSHLEINSIPVDLVFRTCCRLLDEGAKMVTDENTKYKAAF